LSSDREVIGYWSNRGRVDDDRVLIGKKRLSRPH